MSKDKMGVKGFVEYWLTDLDNNEIPGTRKRDHNNIESDLKKYLAKAMANTSNTGGFSSVTNDVDITTNFGVSRIEKGCILHGISPNDTLSPKLGVDLFVTTINNVTGVSSEGNDTYIELYGYLTGASGGTQLFGIHGTHPDPCVLMLGYDISANKVLNNLYATYYPSSGVNVAENRRFHFYWKINM